MASEAIKRLRECAEACQTPGTVGENAERRIDFENTFDASTVLDLLDIAEAAQDLLDDTVDDEETHAREVLRAALSKLGGQP